MGEERNEHKVPKVQTRTAIQIKKTIIENGSKVSSAKEKAKEPKSRPKRAGERVRKRQNDNSSWQSDSSPSIRTWIASDGT